jgi:hypothetical protein
VLDRLRYLTDVCAINVCAYTILSNRFHVLLHVDVDKVQDWTDRQVIEQWNRLYNGHVLVDRYLAGEAMSNAEWEELSKLIEKWRTRIDDISMVHALNEPISGATRQCRRSV